VYITESVNYLGFDLDIDFDYQPEEPQTMLDPHVDEEVEITAVRLGAHDIIDLLGDKSLSQLEAILLEDAEEDYEDLRGE